jgi:hypothetical protein
VAANSGAAQPSPHFEGGDEGGLRDFDFAELAHPLFALFLLFEESAARTRSARASPRVSWLPRESWGPRPANQEKERPPRTSIGGRVWEENEWKVLKRRPSPREVFFEAAIATVHWR